MRSQEYMFKREWVVGLLIFVFFGGGVYSERTQDGGILDGLRSGIWEMECLSLYFGCLLIDDVTVVFVDEFIKNLIDYFKFLIAFLMTLNVCHTYVGRYSLLSRTDEREVH